MTKLEQFNREYEKVKNDKLDCVLLEIQMPTGEIETIINPNVEEKVKYINKTYNEDLVHSNCDKIKIINYMFVTAQAFDFSWALTMLKDGHRMRRKGWNGKGLEVALQPGYERVFANEHTRDAFDLEVGTEIKVMPYFQIKNGDVINTWVPSISDILAEDWEVIE